MLKRTKYRVTNVEEIKRWDSVQYDRGKVKERFTESNEQRMIRTE
jgi:hypothetical protein